MIPGSANPLLLTSAAAAGGYQVSRSVRFSSSDSAYLSRTPASAGNRKTWTWAGWVKRTDQATSVRTLFIGEGGTSNTTYARLIFNQNKLYFGPYSGWWRITAQVFRDPSAWYHVLLAVDTTQSTANNRVRLYLNGTEITEFSTLTNPTQNDDTGINNNVFHGIGADSGGSYFDGYLADIHFIDGQALTPSSFTEVSATTGQLVPKAYSGPTPTGNSFWLPFSDNSAATATTLGKDNFNLGNNWTPNNLSVFSATKSGAGSVTAGAPFNSSFPWTTAFDGAIDLTGAVSNASGANSFVWTFASTLTGTTAAFVVHDTYVPDFDTGNKAAINGTALTSSNWTKTTNTLPVASGAAGDYKVYTYSLGGSPLSTVGVGNAVRIAAVLLDGIPLIFDLSGTNDSLVDTPTSYGVDDGLGGSVRGNYATLNPLASAGTFSNGNLEVSVSAFAETSGLATFGLPASGKWYWEVAITAVGTDSWIGISTGNSQTSLGSSYYIYRFSGAFSGLPAPASTPPTGATYTTGDIIGVAYNADAATLALYKNNAIQGTFTGIPAGLYFPVTYCYNNANRTLNFGQRQWAYAAPAGFKALCDTNLPAPVVAKGSSAFDALLYTGNGASRSITGLSFNPDLVWIKERNAAADHALYDAVRGVQIRLESNTTDAEVATDGGVTAFNSDGFSLGTLAQVNTNADTYVAWAWDAGSSTVTNTAGSISSQVRANASAGFSIVTYTGTGANATVGHGLGVAPDLVIVKRRSTTGDWQVRHTSITAANSIQLNLDSLAAAATTVWNSTAPSSTVFSVGTNATVNASGGTYVAYCWSKVNSFSSIGSYTGNGSADGPFVFTGMRPRWVLIKGIDGGDHWYLYDSARLGYNPRNEQLTVNLSDAEYDAVSYPNIDICANGFKTRTTNAGRNASGVNYLYIAFAESPFQYARAR